jgi:hypothetical protein
MLIVDIGITNSANVLVSSSSTRYMLGTTAFDINGKVVSDGAVVTPPAAATLTTSPSSTPKQSVLRIAVPKFTTAASAYVLISYAPISCPAGLCAAGTYAATPCTQYALSQCTSCSTRPCAPGTYLSDICSASSDRTCTACTATCPTGLYLSKACTPVENSECSVCSSCGPGAKQEAACSRNSDTLCTCPEGTFGNPYGRCVCVHALVISGLQEFIRVLFVNMPCVQGGLPSL